MNIKSNSTVSFKGYVPVKYMAKDDETGRYLPVTSDKLVRKCQNFVVRNLNGTAQKNFNEDFVELYKKYDKDYARTPIVHSVYDKRLPIVHMVTGADVQTVENFAKPVGIAKGAAMDSIGRSSSFEASMASRNYFKNVRAFIQGQCKRLKSENGKNLSLVVYFDPKYTRTDKLKGLDYAGALFTEEA